jgi:diphthamide synthase (EF-2-diphthine--ammonia ligase)
MNNTIAVGDIITIDEQQVRVEQLSELPGRAYVMPLKYSEQHGLVRSGRSFWADVVDETWDAQMGLVNELTSNLRASVNAARAAGLDAQWIYDAVDQLRDELA